MSDNRQQRKHHLDRPVAGADLHAEDRPGVPMEQPAHPLTTTTPELVERMRPRRGLTHRREIGSMTPVFGTAEPLHGVSGLLRRMAYATRETRTPHWMLLLFSDRVDVLEHPGVKLVKLAGLVPGGGAGRLRLAHTALPCAR